MKIRLEPRLVIWLAMAEAVPLLTAIMMMTAATPMMMPSMVSSERILFLRTASQEIRNTSVMFMSTFLVCQRIVRTVMDDRVDLPIFQMDDPLGVLSTTGSCVTITMVAPCRAASTTVS